MCALVVSNFVTSQRLSVGKQLHSHTAQFLLQALDRDLEDAEEQYGAALRGHLQVIDSLQDLQYARMKTMQEQFQSNLKASPLPA